MQTLVLQSFILFFIYVSYYLLIPTDVGICILFLQKKYTDDDDRYENELQFDMWQNNQRESVVHMYPK